MSDRGESEDEFFEANEEFSSSSSSKLEEGVKELSIAEKNAAIKAGCSMQLPCRQGGTATVIADVHTGEEDDLEANIEGSKSVITHLLSQVRVGMDLTKVVLPTFILERRSMLEMYADFFAHADLFARIPEYDTPRERFIEVVRWYISSFHAGRRSSLAKKPYNPILGETFQCMWDVPATHGVTESMLENGPVAWAHENSVSFIAEQVSHHPPVAAFYAEHPGKRVSCCAHIWTKSKFLGLSICAHLVGEGTLTDHVHNETYRVTFPSAYARSILTTPWMEMGGKAEVTCEKSGLSASIEFICKPFVGGTRHRVTGELKDANEKKPFMSLDGLWNGVVNAKVGNQTSVFVDTTTMTTVPKLVRELESQAPTESRRLWKEVTANLPHNITVATEAKVKLEEKQREEARTRKETGAVWKHKYFHGDVEHGFEFNHPLSARL
ncbi:oxysterol-binding protein-related protein 9-like isoform X2 [Sycon ciliatum]